MASTVNTNLVSLNSQRNLGMSQSSLTNAMQRLSSGLRVNSAKDDAAGLAISERMGAQVRGMNVAVRNANDAISLTQTAEGAMAKVGDSLQRMRELAVQSRNATNSGSDKDSLDKEFGELAKEIQRVIGGTTFNGKHIIGSDADTQTFQIGANTSSDDTIDLATTNMGSAADLTAVAGTDNTGAARAVIDSTTNSTSLATVIDNIDTAIDFVNGERATMGAAQNRFDAVISNLQVSVENQSAARSRITDDTIDLATTNMGSAADLTAVAGTDNTGAARAVIDSTTDATDLAGVIDDIDAAIDFVNGERATMGAAQNRFDAVISNLQVSVENQSAARSRITDADFATETANLSRAQILQQAGNAMVAQANQLPQQVLRLLQ